MIDLHSHVLFGVDDGPKTAAESLDLLRGAAQDGTRRIVATPHTCNQAYMNSPAKVRQAVAELNRLAGDSGIDIEVVAGSEVHFFENVLGAVRADEVMSFADMRKYVLVEFPTRYVPQSARAVFFELLIAGITPVIAHPERNHEFLENQELLSSLVDSGARVQLTADSILGAWGRAPKKAMIEFLKGDLGHFIASDGHHPKLRPARMSEAVKEVARVIGKSRAEQMVEANPEAVLAGVPMPPAA